ncbi:MAG: SDR family NAD(P)-dependent oxidoreductase [Bdellovibrionales bacterium]|nr:SDR family NAD(P)-dependent oxidoreductase [Bdellovibrionales bacterium]
MSYIDLSNINNALIVGAGHGIGLAFCEEILKLNPQIAMHATYRREEKANKLFDLKKSFSNLSIYQVNPVNEAEVINLKTKSKIQKINLLINCIGTLQDDTVSPERSLREIDISKLQHYFLINSSITPLLAKHFKDCFRGKHSSCFAAISAKVGSIDDNSLGGWYGYRASKAALNMFIINISIEFKRSAPNSVVLAIHPGTTITELSEDFIQNTNLKLHKPNQTAENILNIIKNKDPKQTGQFVSWDQSNITW